MTIRAVFNSRLIGTLLGTEHRLAISIPVLVFSLLDFTTTELTVSDWVLLWFLPRDSYVRTRFRAIFSLLVNEPPSSLVEWNVGTACFALPDWNVCVLE